MRLIDADALKESVHAHDYVLKDCLNSTDKGMFTVGIMQAIDAQPTVDAVRHGKWKLAKDGWYCSACELYPPFDCDPEEKGIPYCPYCGAKMYETQKKPCGDCQQFDCYGCEYAERKEE